LKLGKIWKLTSPQIFWYTNWFVLFQRFYILPVFATRKDTPGQFFWKVWKKKQTLYVDVSKSLPLIDWSLLCQGFASFCFLSK
jgi:hypothetical protein